MYDLNYQAGSPALKSDHSLKYKVQNHKSYKILKKIFEIHGKEKKFLELAPKASSINRNTDTSGFTEDKTFLFSKGFC